MSEKETLKLSVPSMTSSPKRSLQRTNRFARDVKRLPDNIKHEAFMVAQKLCEDIFNKQLDVKELVGLKGNFRVVVANHYRMIFSFDENNISLLRIAHRKDIYRSIQL